MLTLQIHDKWRTLNGTAYMFYCEQDPDLMIFAEEQKLFWSIVDDNVIHYDITTSHTFERGSDVVNDIFKTSKEGYLLTKLGVQDISFRRILVHTHNRDGRLILEHSANCLIPLLKQNYAKVEKNSSPLVTQMGFEGYNRFCHLLHNNEDKSFKVV